MILLTFDQDWAPAWATERILARLEAAGLGATLFVTHQCSSLRSARRRPEAIELAWHPNFLDGSTHGDSQGEVLDHLADIVPEAVGVRAHCLVRSTPLLVAYGERGLRYEASDLMEGQAHLEVIRAWNGVARIPIYWEDDVHLMHGRDCTVEAMRLDAPGIKSLTFHPVLVALNATELGSYQGLKSVLATSGRGLAEAEESDVERFRNTAGPGIGDLFEAVVDLLSKGSERGGVPLRDLLEDSVVD